MVYDLSHQKLLTLPSQESGSHYVWNTKNQLLASCIMNAKSCYVLFDMNNIHNYHTVASAKLNSDGHQSFITNDSFVTDTYPDKWRLAKLYKVDIEDDNVELLASLYSPKEFQTCDFKKHIACDLHPRVSPSGKYVCFDSPRTGKRALYIMNL
jgi:Tol biopolymer transport system component